VDELAILFHQIRTVAAAAAGRTAAAVGRSAVAAGRTAAAVGRSAVAAGRTAAAGGSVSGATRRIEGSGAADLRGEAHGAMCGTVQTESRGVALA
jgi:hypothetical protein